MFLHRLIKKTPRLITYPFYLVFALFLMVAMMSSPLLSIQFKSHSIKDVVSLISSDSLFRMVTSENRYFQLGSPKEHTSVFSAKNFIKMTTNLAFNDQRSFLGNELPGFKLFDSKILVAGEGTNYTNMPIDVAPPASELIEKSPVQENAPIQRQPISYLKTNGEVVHIYFTHTRESFLPQLEGQTNANLAQDAKINVIDVGEKVGSALEERGIGTSIDQTDVVSILQRKKEKYSHSYVESRALVQEVLARNRNIHYLIDIHRDSQRKALTTFTKNNVAYARIAFIIGGDNPHSEQNKALANALHQKLNKLMPGLSRGVFEKKGKGTNGKFNQDLSNKAMLIEFGGVDNNLDELSRTAEVFAEAFSQYYWQVNSVNSQPAIQTVAK